MLCYLQLESPVMAAAKGIRMDTNATRAWCVACALTALVGCSSAETLGPGAESDASVSGLDVQPDVTVALDGQGALTRP